SRREESGERPDRMELPERSSEAVRRAGGSHRARGAGTLVILSEAKDPFALEILRFAQDDVNCYSVIMRKICLFLAISAAFTLQLAAQNTDIESLSGLQFNFGNPGARSLGMGGAFLGLADDASAAEANPAGLTILRKPEITIEGRNYQEQQVFTTSGTFPDLKRTAFSHYSQRMDATFA